jgi:cysteine desulfurase/selenocysteine lyase
MHADRRRFLQTLLPLGGLAWTRTRRAVSLGAPYGGAPPGAAGTASPSRDPAAWRSHFPVLSERVGGQPLAYLDSAATAQRPRAVSRAVAAFDEHRNANPSPTLHTLARRADAEYAEARRTAARFIHAADPLEIVFTRGTTDGLNLVAAAWGGAHLRPGDEVLLTIAEHASSMLPWQLAAKRAGAVVRYLDVDDEGRLRLDRLDALLTPRTRVFAFTHVSNVVGYINPAKALCERARRAGCLTVVDAAQSAPHLRLDVQELGCDFLAFSGHKLMGPMGTGVLWGRRALLDALPPYQAGSNMAHAVGLDSADYSPGALKFGAGTPNVAGAVGLATAMRFIDAIGYEALWAHEQALTRHALARLGEVPGLRLLGPRVPEQRVAVFSFVLAGAAPPQIVAALDARGIAVRGGDLAALPLLERLGVSRAARASLYLYSTEAEIDRLAAALRDLAR